MLQVPNSLLYGNGVERSPMSEDALLKKCREWLEREERKAGLHASDLLDPRMAFFKRLYPEPLPDRLVNMFIVGKFGHIIVLSAVDGLKGIDMESDEGSVWSEDLEIWYSSDKTIDGKPRELKTTRKPNEAKSPFELSLYLEQLLIYMVARDSTIGQLWVLYLNLRDEEGESAPTWRVYTVTVSKEDLADYRKQIKTTVAAIKEAQRTGDISKLPLCRKWKCGKKKCQYFEECRPEGRYGLSEKKWAA